MATGGAMTTGAASATVVSLTNGVINAMFLSKLKVPVAVMVLATTLGTGTGQIAYRVMAKEDGGIQQVATPGKKLSDSARAPLGTVAGTNANLDLDMQVLFGDERKAARIQFGEIVISGAKITVNRKANIVEVQGAGDMSMPSNTTFEGGQPVRGNARLTIRWNRDMFFNGKYADFQGDVEASQDNAKLKCHSLEVTLDRLVSFKQGQEKNQEVNVEKLVCDRNVWVENEKRDQNGKRLGFDRLTATSLAVDQQAGRATIAYGPGKVEHLALSTGNDSQQAPGARQNSKAPGSTADMRLTRVLFSARMYTNEKDSTRVGKFYDDVKVFHFPTDNVTTKMNPDNPPKDGFYLECHVLTVLTRHVGNKTHQEMMAEGNVDFRAQEFIGRAAVVKYDESQDQIIFEGTPDNLAILYRKDSRDAQPQEIKGRRILYNRKSGTFSADGVLITAPQSLP